MEFDAERVGNVQNGIEGRGALAGKGFVEAFAGEALMGWRLSEFALLLLHCRAGTVVDLPAAIRTAYPQNRSAVGGKVSFLNRSRPTNKGDNA